MKNRMINHKPTVAAAATTSRLSTATVRMQTELGFIMHNGP